MKEYFFLEKTEEEKGLAFGSNNCQLGKLEISFQRFKNLKTSRKAYFYDQKRKHFFFMLGYFSNQEEINRKNGVNFRDDVELLDFLFEKFGQEAISEFDGCFLIFFYDIGRQQGKVFQSQFGFREPIYYFKEDRRFFISNKLSKLSKRIKSPKKLDYKAVKEFLFFENIIPNKKTLIKNVFKLIPGKYLHFDLREENFEIKKFNYKKKRKIFLNPGRKIVETVSKNILAISRQLNLKKITQTFTAGWDSNLMMHELQKTKKEIATATVSGGGECNEIPQVKKIIEKYYPQTEFLASEVRPDIISQMEDIAARTEGYFFQEGIFLRYQLGKLLQEKNIPAILLGSAADQVLFPETPGRKFFRKIKQVFFSGDLANKGEKEIRSQLKNNCQSPEFYIKLDYNMKMHQLLLGSFGIEGFFPFVNKKTAGIARAVGILNYKKRIYKNFLKKYLPAGISKRLKKSGDTVDTKNIFQQNKEKILQVLDSELVKKIFNKKQIQTIKKNPDDCHLLLMQLLYIDFFEKIFIKENKK